MWTFRSYFFIESFMNVHLPEGAQTTSIAVPRRLIKKNLRILINRENVNITTNLFSDINSREYGLLRVFLRRCMVFLS